MELLGVAIAAGLLIVASIAVYLRRRTKQRRPVDSDPESERALRDFRRGKTLGQSQYGGLDNTGHWR
ncbi:hypothetical protein LN996_01055 [Arthrobacter sp. AK01]|uniref:hypothetical protein n=1 Tax=Arthrobacter sp. AK01 TaxID=2894084 RepID=UPI001E58A5A7|nr:hypothetical protein [Arthrobacter sp. AK01]MCD4849390.1 hypothetical protein [Arthrobacter sp. AK01]MCP1410889.1 hypothetical protein [Paenarthrobacter sp. A20]